MEWDITLLRTFMEKLELDKRVAIQEFPSLELIAKIVQERRPLLTLINVDIDDFDSTVFKEEEVQTFKLFTETAHNDKIVSMVNNFRHYCMARLLAELGYVNIDRNLITTLMIEYPLLNVEYCKDEVRYVYERLKKLDSPLLSKLQNYPITRSRSPLDVLAYMILDLNLLGARSIINEFYLTFTSRPEESTSKLIAAHLLYFTLPAISLGSLVKIDNKLLEFILKSLEPVVIQVETQHVEKTTHSGDLSKLVLDYRTTLTTMLNMLNRAENLLDIPQLLTRLRKLDEHICAELNIEKKHRYMILTLLVPRKGKQAYHTRYINNLGLLVKTSDDRLSN